VALLSFPPNPNNGDFFPVLPPTGTNVYQWDSTTATWRLIGTATGVTPGTYGTPLAVPEVTVDAVGRITFAQDVLIQTATTSQAGLVQLTDDTVSNDPSTALTAAQGYYLQSQIGNISLLSPSASNLVSAINGAGGPTGVTPGIYGTSAQVGRFTINAQGRITAATNVPIAVATPISTGVVSVGANLNITGAGLLSVPTASTTVPGVTQLIDDTSTNDSTKALTAAQGYSLQQQINSIEVQNNLTFAGSLNAFTGFLTQVTPVGVATGFIAGDPLPVSSPLNNEFFVVVDTPGTYTPPGGTPTVCSSGDWFLSDGTQWLFFDYNTGSVSLVNTGVGLTGGPITTSGTISLSNTGVLPGSYTNANITVSLQGRITSASSGFNILVSTPASSASPGTRGQIAVGTGFFYWYDGTQWLRIAGSTF
jgi:hypothetical protein